MATPERYEELKVNLVKLQEEFEPGYFCKTLKDDLACSYSDLYKSFNGFRPRWVDFSELSELDILVMMDDLVTAEQELQQRIDEDARLDKEAKERAMTCGVGDLVEPEWKAQLRELVA